MEYRAASKDRLGRTGVQTLAPHDTEQPSPNLPQVEAKALRRLQGLDVAPDLVGIFPDLDVLICHYLPGPEWQDDRTTASPVPIQQAFARSRVRPTKSCNRSTKFWPAAPDTSSRRLQS